MNEMFAFVFSLVALAVSVASLLYNRRGYLEAKRRLNAARARRVDLAAGGVIRFESPKVADGQVEEIVRKMRAAMNSAPPRH